MELALDDCGFDFGSGAASSAGDCIVALLVAVVFLVPRLETVPVVVLLFSEDVFELPFPLLALRVLLLRAI